MDVRRLRTVTAVLVFAFVAAQPAAVGAASVVKPGAKCSVAGKVQTFNKVRLLCSRVGGKLVWVAPKITMVPPKVVVPPTVQQLFGEKPWFVASAAISTLSRTAPQLRFDTTVVSPNFNTELIAPLLEYQALASTYWNSVGFTTDRPVRAVFLTEKDQAWFDSTIGITAPVVNSFFDMKSSNYFNGSVIIGRIPASMYTIVYFVGTTFTRDTNDWQWRLATMATHEYQHLVQYEATLTTSGVNLQQQLPCWFGEGFAAFYEDSFYYQDGASPNQRTSLQVGVKTDEWFVNQRTARMTTLKNVLRSLDTKNTVDTWTAEQWLGFVNDNYASGSAVCAQARYGYRLGRVFVEKLHVDHGAAKLLELLRTFKQTQNWERAFAQVYGGSEQVWLRETAVPYLLEQRFWA